MIANGTTVIVQLVDKEEFMGLWKELEGPFVELEEAAQIVIIMVPDPQNMKAGPHPQRTIIPVEDHGNFGKSVFLRKDKIIFVREMKGGGAVFSMYKQAVTGLSLPRQPAIVVPFPKPGGGDGEAS